MPSSRASLAVRLFIVTLASLAMGCGFRLPGTSDVAIEYLFDPGSLKTGADLPR
jgi:hypothetical protein